MNKTIWILSTVLVILTIGCTPQIEVAAPTDISAPASTGESTAQSEGVLLELPTPIPGTVALDFAEKPCNASWSNNGEYLPCPGTLEDTQSGYADRFDETIINGNIHIEQPGLLTIPSQPSTGFYAIFGKYPPFTVMEGDRFRAVLACRDGFPNCNADASLEYYNASGQFMQIPEAEWNVSVFGEDYIYADVDLSLLASKTVQFTLTVRDNGDAVDDHIVWIMPHIARIGGAATDAIPPHQLNIAKIDTINVSGTVEMQSAPPYLDDDHPPGSPAVVVFFDVHSDLWFMASTLENHPNFSIDVLSGEYYVMAYSYGVGDVPYVSAAYTGIDPSCGQKMAVLKASSGKPLSGVKINDWNWSCGGDALRLEKPEEVSLP